MEHPRILLLGLALVVLTTLLAPKEALAHPLGFESDLSEDGVISVCNPDGIFSGRLATGIDQWNAVAVGAADGMPTFSDVTSTGSFCEVRLEEAGGDRAHFYARLVFGSHPDRLQVSRRLYLPPQILRTARPGSQKVSLGEAPGRTGRYELYYRKVRR